MKEIHQKTGKSIIFLTPFPFYVQETLERTKLSEGKRLQVYFLTIEYVVTLEGG